MSKEIRMESLDSLDWNQLKAGDVVVVKSFSDLGNSLQACAASYHFFIDRMQVGVVIEDFPELSTDSDEGRHSRRRIKKQMEIIDYLLQTDKKVRRKVQAEGIAAAKARGVRLGRPKNIELVK